MGTFTDKLLLQMTSDLFVRQLLSQSMSVTDLFDTVFALETMEVHDLTLDAIERREFARGVMETVRTRGFDERIVPVTERTRIERTQPRNGRMAWVDVFIDVALSAKVHSTASHLESLTVESLIEKLGGAATLAVLRTKLEAMYPPGVVDAFFSALDITSIEDFERDPSLFLRFAFKAAPPFDPSLPGPTETFHLSICLMIHEELKIAEALRAAKLCRSILATEIDSIDAIEGGEVRTPFAFAVIFPDAAVTDQTLPELTAAQVKAMTKSMFRAERMVAHFA